MSHYMEKVYQYHQRSKHSLKAYAAGPETIDWDDQPDPFRRFDGSKIVPLPRPGKQLDLSWKQLHASDQLPCAPLNLENLGLLLELSFGLSAWKQYGPDRWALRCNPSSGNLHPTEAYVVSGIENLIAQGVYHYVSYDHHLEQRYLFENHSLNHLLLVGLSSIHWREAWKYGERAFRYCQLDIGHALGALNYAARCLGWRIEPLVHFSNQEIACLLGLDCDDEFIKHEYEEADLLCRIVVDKGEGNHQSQSVNEQQELLQTMQANQWFGKARSLKAYHMYHWPVIDEIAQHTQQNYYSHQAYLEPEFHAGIETQCTLPATQIIRNRRSAQGFNPASDNMPFDQFIRILDAVSPNHNVPFNGWSWLPATHLCLFIHRVEGLDSGIYCFLRSDQGLAHLKANLNPQFEWQPVEKYPKLYLLIKSDVKKIAKTLSCHQNIASDGCFSLSMLCEFKPLIEQHAWNYRRLFWECGLVGQILYLEAEAEGYRGTGIGCFFDDDLHELIGISGNEIQSLYHFTIGEPVIDARIQSFPAYSHLLIE